MKSEYRIKILKCATKSIKTNIYYKLSAIIIGLFLAGAQTALSQDAFDGFIASVNNTVRTISVQTDGKVLIGGEFTGVNGLSRNRIARLNSIGSTDSNFNPNANGAVNCLALQSDGKILIGGEFTSVGGLSRNRIARLNSDGTPDPSFNPNANFAVRSLATQSDGKILIGGEFTSIGGISRNKIARLNFDGTLDAAFNPDISGTVFSMVLQTDGKILIGGTFTSVGGLSRSKIARLNSDGTPDPNFNPKASAGNVFAVAIQSNLRYRGKILLGGTFGGINGYYREGIAQLNADNTLDSSFNARLVGNQALNPATIVGIYSVALQPDGKILIGGLFTSIGGKSKNNIARLNPDGTLDAAIVWSGIKLIHQHDNRTDFSR